MRYFAYLAVVGVLAGAAVVSARALVGQASSESPEKQDEQKQQKKTPQEYEEEMEDFVPSEKVPADSAISFPVDV